MDNDRFDHLVQGLGAAKTRRSVLGGLAALGGAAILPDDGLARKSCRKRGKKKCNGKCIPLDACCSDADCGPGETCEAGLCTSPGPPPDRCGGPVGICDADPTPCGTSATGEICGCERAVEGNNFCANAGDGVCGERVECTSTDGPEGTSCSNLVGLHFFCQEAKRGASGRFCGCGFGTATGRVCVPECDNLD